MEMRRILFVDDDSHILEGFERNLRNLRNEFAIFYVESAVEGLKLIEKMEFDVVFSDLRMPKIDGMTFLREVQERSPHTIRIMLTAQSEMISTFKMVDTIHQYLIKPCSFENLKRTILQASSFHKLMKLDKSNLIFEYLNSNSIKWSDYEGKINDLEQTEIQIYELEQLANCESTVTTKTLKMLNLSISRDDLKIDNLKEAIEYFGFDIIRDMAICVQLFSIVEEYAELCFPEELMYHSAIVGTLAKKIAETHSSKKTVAYKSLIAGALHDIGKFIINSRIQSLCQSTSAAVDPNHKTSLESAHSNLGAFLAALLGFPSEIVEAIGFHHSLEDKSSAPFSPALSVYAANVLYNQFYLNEDAGVPSLTNRKDFQLLNMKRNFRKWYRLCYSYLDDLYNFPATMPG